MTLDTKDAAAMSDSRVSEFQGVLIFLLILCIVTVSLRCYTRYFIVQVFAVEDWLAVLCLVRPRRMPNPGSPYDTRVDKLNLNITNHCVGCR